MSAKVGESIIDNMKKESLLITVAVAVVLGIGGYLYMKNQPAIGPGGLVRPESGTPPSGVTPAPTTEVSLGGQIYQAVANPAENIPETNPFAQEINPYKAVKTNPFVN